MDPFAETVTSRASPDRCESPTFIVTRRPVRTRFYFSNIPIHASKMARGRMYRQMKAKEFVTNLVRQTYEKVYDEENDCYFYYSKLHGTSQWSAPRALQGQCLDPKVKHRRALRTCAFLTRTACSNHSGSFRAMQVTRKLGLKRGCPNRTPVFSRTTFQLPLFGKVGDNNGTFKLCGHNRRQPSCVSSCGTKHFERAARV